MGAIEQSQRFQLMKAKKECHRLMSVIWGNSRQGRASAYSWLAKEFGKEIHFSRLLDISEILYIKCRLFEFLILGSKHKLIQKSDPSWSIYIEDRNTRARVRKKVKNRVFR